MSVLYTVAVLLSEAVRWTWYGVQVIAVVMGVWAFVDSLLRPAEYYVAAGKSTKRFWNVVNAVGTVVVGVLGAASMLGLLGVVASAVYLVDVRPALQALAPVRVRSSIRIPGRASQRRPGRGAGRGPRDWSPGR
ncbi:DUF2516 family protein [Actinomyces viscosus]|uniref:DUF2516 family protein n=1 Tax=Actinomyces viscosus TaxID=1656 RepID=UPI0028EE5253|nr:DUF2516 family protein [Actinomyces viscosus]